ncbi:MAG TPA: WhiB family transcriptional regulator [Mycobacteriales bacterium]|nr:WhiB family transcriptional regulator [Mycobacteriales bacterium]
MIDVAIWRAYAECQADNATYFYAPAHFERKPEKDYREGIARALWRACKVQPQCLQYSLEVAESHGIWGGLNELERKRLLRRRKAEAEAAAAAETACPA